MRVLVTGGTGTIGSAVATVLNEWGGRVAVLCRTPAAITRVEEMGCEPVSGDIAEPQDWVGVTSRFDAVVHAAASFDARMGELDTTVVDALLERLRGERRRKKLLYTGGVWLFGNTAGPRDETAPYDPPAEWGWMADNAARVMHSRDVHALVVHPAIVVEDDSGLPRILVAEAAQSGEVRLPCAAAATWPLVDRADLGQLYARALDAAPAGEMYIGASLPAVPVARLAAALAQRLGLAGGPVETPIERWMDKHGAWAGGYALSQNLVADKARQQLGWQPGFALPD